MNFKKLLTILGGAIGLLIIFFVLKGVFFTDKVKPILGSLVATNQQLLDLSKEAAGNLEDFDYKKSAADITNVIASDNYQLSKYYQDKYSKRLPKYSGTVSLKTLQSAPSGVEYDGKYRELAASLKEASADLATQTAQASTSNQLDTLINRYLEHLDAIFANF